LAQSDTRTARQGITYSVLFSCGLVHENRMWQSAGWSALVVTALRRTVPASVASLMGLRRAPQRLGCSRVYRSRTWRPAVWTRHRGVQDGTTV
jgi:hypothetical protein